MWNQPTNSQSFGFSCCLHLLQQRKTMLGHSSCKSSQDWCPLHSLWIATAADWKETMQPTAILAADFWICIQSASHQLTLSSLAFHPMGMGIFHPAPNHSILWAQQCHTMPKTCWDTGSKLLGINTTIRMCFLSTTCHCTVTQCKRTLLSLKLSKRQKACQHYIIWHYHFMSPPHSLTPAITKKNYNFLVWRLL